MTLAELDDLIDSDRDIGAILLTVSDWEAIIRPAPSGAEPPMEVLTPWTYRGLKVWIVYGEPSHVVDRESAKRAKLA